MNATSKVIRSLISNVALSIIPRLRAIKEKIVFLEKLIGEKNQKINLLIQEIGTLKPSPHLDKNVIQHGYIRYSPNLNFSGAAIQQTANSKQQEIIKRIADVIQKELELEETVNTSAEGLWGTIIENHKEIVFLLKSNHHEAENYLEKMFTTSLTAGFQQGDYIYNLLCKYESFRDHLNRFQMDKLCGLAEALGVVAVENPEQGGWGDLMASDPNDLLILVEKSLHIKLIAPSFQAGAHGLHTAQGVFTDREFFSILIAKTISELVADKDVPICEIGGGGGSLAFYCWQFGFRNITVIDLPTVNIAQSYWLHRNLPEAPLYFSGEENIFDKTPGIRVLSTRYFELAPHKHYGLVVNVDSFPELPSNAVQNYLEKMKNNTNLFLSINQEAMAYADAIKKTRQLIVHEQVKLAAGFHRKSRHPFWLRKGYVEEIYEIEE